MIKKQYVQKKSTLIRFAHINQNQEKMIQLIFLNISGNNFLLNFHINYLIKDLRTVINLHTGISCQEIRLIYCYKELYDNQYLNHFDIGSGSCIQIKLKIKGVMSKCLLIYGIV